VRRGTVFGKKAYIFLAITAFFNLLAITFDQLVIQQEDKIRFFDKNLNKNELEVKSFLYSHNVFDELMNKVHFNSLHYIAVFNFQRRAINFLNSELPKKIEESKIQNIKEIYLKKINKLNSKFILSKNETKIILDKISDNNNFQNYINKNISVNKNFTEIKNELDKKIDYNFLEQYDFNQKNTEKQVENYKIYLKQFDEFYTHLLQYYQLRKRLGGISDNFKEEFNRSFTNYYILADDFTLQKNKKNFLILLSILFQILGLVFLVILFKTLIVENK
jgi:hypothetical protein|tara:strand:+ start:947 stop:1774 length:828 start_codon:yes stop_codon:yes gene_type:complete